MRYVSRFLSLLAAIVLVGFSTSCSTIDNSKNEFPPSGKSLQEVYAGYWEVISLQDNPYYDYLREDGKCFNNWENGDRGVWQIRAERVIMEWETGWVDWLYFENGKFHKITFAPQTRMSYKSTGVRAANKISYNAIPKGAMLKINRMQK
jgi:hypothetical protein